LGPRVLAAEMGQPILVSMPAFPDGPLRHWVSYGTGVHALHGLGDRNGAETADEESGTARAHTPDPLDQPDQLSSGSSRYEPFYAPSVTYPDPVSGFTAAFAIMAAVVGRDRGHPIGRAEVPLFNAVQPLLGFRAGDPTGGAEADVEPVGGMLFDAGMATGAFTSLPVAGMQLMHPRSPFLM
jgi:crotonobetainyl-CoA:carnitine CoA-transferase CaiB-like acyl-CoA transferase